MLTENASVLRGTLQPRDIVTLGRQLRLPWPPFSLRTKDKPFRLGRSDDNDVVLNHETVSAEHARITLRDDGFLLEDAGSSNGVYISGSEERVTRRVVDSRAAIRIGIYTIPIAYLFS